MESVAYLEVVRDRSAALLEAAQTDLGASVPSCPGWTVTDLLTHVGGIWGWAAAIVRTGDRADLPSFTAGQDGPALVAWAAEQASQLVSALENANPDSDCWTFGLPRSNRFWLRRQALETAVHAWDAQQATARQEPIGSDVAADGIGEYLALTLPRRFRDHPDSWKGESLHLHRTDGEGEWMITLGPGAELSTENTHAKGDVALRGTASSLYLWCLNRVPLTDVEVFGDRDVALRWTAEISF
ncbi:MAG TPA: maleylpyruvate isomerase family mycothiol-dependent enzyme [Acidimicrobiales bacterium]|jgi:uncharacterized protein (TIGR03083 family)